jgi:RNA polymerase sigma-70 factor (ECF subfamily)
MREPAPGPAPPSSRFEDISTRTSLLNDPQALVQRYGRAVRCYLEAKLGSDDAEEVAQEFMVKILRGGFADRSPGRGRFRDYLKKAVLNTLRDFLRRKRGLDTSIADLERFPDVAGSARSSGDIWLKLWRETVLESALQKLSSYQDQHAGNVFSTVVELLRQNPGASSGELADLLTKATGHSYRDANARKQIERTRRRLAGLLHEEVRQTLQDPAPEDVKDECRVLGLWCHVEGYVSPG